MQTWKPRLEVESCMQQSFLQLAGHKASSKMRAAAAVRTKHSISSHFGLPETAQIRIALDWRLQITKEPKHLDTCQRERVCRLSSCQYSMPDVPISTVQSWNRAAVQQASALAQVISLACVQVHSLISLPSMLAMSARRDACLVVRSSDMLGA